MWFVVEIVAWAATTGAVWVAALNHKSVDDAVENYSVVERLTSLGAVRKVNEVSNSYRCFVSEKVDFNCAVIGVQGRYVSVLSHGSILAESH
jgi:hypothetical protein